MACTHFNRKFINTFDMTFHLIDLFVWKNRMNKLSSEYKKNVMIFSSTLINRTHQDASPIQNEGVRCDSN